MWTAGPARRPGPRRQGAERARSSPTTSTSPSRSPSCPRTASWRCSAARRRRSSTSPWTRTPRSRPGEPGRTGRAATSAPIAAPVRHHRPRAGPADRWLLDTVRWAWRTRILIAPRRSTCGSGCAQAAEEEAVRVFAANLRDLLLAAPAGSRATMGLDPGLRTGVKVAVVDATGKVVATDTIYPHEPRRQLGRVARHAGAAGRAARRRAGRDRQRHRRRGRPTSSPAELITRHPRARADQGDGVRGRRLGLLGVRVRLAGAARTSTCRCAARSPSPAGCRTRSPSW